MRLVNVVLAIIETLTVHLMDKGSVNSATYLYNQGTGMGAPQFYGFAEIDMDYSQEPSEVKRDRKKKERYQSILKRCIVCRVRFKRMKKSSNVSSFFFF